MNWRAAVLAIIASVVVTYEEVRDDWDDNESTVFNKEIVLLSWSAAIGLLFGTTTVNQTKEIAKKEIDSEK